jgi:tetratricopeptide (TPR) repeat protein
LCERLGHLDKAAAHLRRAVELQPSDPVAHVELGRVLEHQDEHSAALEQYRLALSLDPDSLDANFGAGMIYKRLKQYPEAVEMFRQAVRLEPHNSEAYKQLAATSALAFFVARGARSSQRSHDKDDSRREARTA